MNHITKFNTDDWQGQAVSAEVMAKLARLMATENISIEHHNVGTAAFDVANRVLLLPNWNNISRNIYNLFVTHEVGHALHTPANGLDHVLTRGAKFKGIVNILEDCRIEKKQKRRFPGAAPQMEAGYRELVNMNFFGTKDRKPNSYGFLDRLNLWSKLGDCFGITFNDGERILVNRAMATETFEEVMELAEELWNHEDEKKNSEPGDDSGQKQKQEGKRDTSDDDHQEGDSGEGEDDQSSPDSGPPSDGDECDEANGDESASSDTDADSDADEDDSSDDDASGSTSGDSDSDGDEGEGDSADDDSADDSDNGGDAPSDNDAGEDDSSEDDSNSGTGDSASNEAGDPLAYGDEWDKDLDTASETDEAAEAAAASFVNMRASGPVYLQVPEDKTFDLDSIIVTLEEIQQEMKLEFQGCIGVTESKFREAALEDLQIFKAKNKKAINFLVKEFEMRKAATASARAATSTTGVLSTEKLHSYKWNDDIFKKITTIPDGKSHGLVMFVDWSGSMQSNMRGTIEQVLTLVLFCQRVNIPFDVYGFTDAYTGVKFFSRHNQDSQGTRQRNLKRGDFEFFDCNLNLLHIASSNTRSKAATTNMMVGLMNIRGHFAHRRSVTSRSTLIESVQGVHGFPLPTSLHLGGTPLSETIMTAIPIVNKFTKANKLEIVNTVFLTDGEGCDLRTAHGIDYSAGHGIVKHNRRQTKIGYSSPERGAKPQLNILIDVLRERTGTHVVNFYICNPHTFKNDVRNATENYGDEGYRKHCLAALKTAKAEGGVTIEDNTDGWDQQYLILGGTHLFVTDKAGRLDKKLVGAKKKELTKAFKEVSMAKFKCRVILKKFVGLIAKNS